MSEKRKRADEAIEMSKRFYDVAEILRKMGITEIVGVLENGDRFEDEIEDEIEDGEDEDEREDKREIKEEGNSDKDREFMRGFVDEMEKIGRGKEVEKMKKIVEELDKRQEGKRG